MFEKCICIGIEVRHRTDFNTKKPYDAYYFHGESVDHKAIEGKVTFSGKLQDSCVSKCVVGKEYLVAYTTYNGYITIRELIEV